MFFKEGNCASALCVFRRKLGKGQTYISWRVWWLWPVLPCRDLHFKFPLCPTFWQQVFFRSKSFFFSDQITLHLNRCDEIWPQTPQCQYLGCATENCIKSKSKLLEIVHLSGVKVQKAVKLSWMLLSPWSWARTFTQGAQETLKVLGIVPSLAAMKRTACCGREISET